MSDEAKTAYPLTWPDGQPPTPAGARRTSAFKSKDRDFNRRKIKHELLLMDATEIIVSCNLVPRGDVLREEANLTKGASPGVAVYFNRKGRPFVFACDMFLSVGENLRAVALTIQSLRAIQRYGVSEMLEKAFTGFTALPPAGGEHLPWWEVLGCERAAAPEDIRARFRQLARENHPDQPGVLDDGAKYARITRAYEEAQKEKNFQ